MRKLTLAFVQTQLVTLQKEIEELQGQRRGLMHQVRKIDRRIAQIQGDGNFTSSDEMRPNRGIVGAHGGHIYTKLIEALTNHFSDGKEFNTDQIVDAFAKVGGKTKSAASIMQVLRQIPGVSRTSRGIYTYQHLPAATTVGKEVGGHYDKLFEAIKTFGSNGFTAKQIVEAFHKVGGKTHSNNPKDTLMKVVRNIPGIQRKSHGIYTYSS
jgi:hypothetical protein